MISEQQKTVSSNLSSQDLRDLVRRASSIVERQSGSFLADDMPDWAATLQEMLALIETLSCEHGFVDKSSWSFLAPDKPYPFEELLSPFVVIAQQRYAKQIGASYSLLSAQAHCTLQRHLLQVLTSLAVSTLHETFLLQRSLDQETQQPVDDVAAYRQFVEWMYRGGLATFLHTYSFLARLLATTTDLWVESNVEFLRRLEADWQDIQQTFGGNIPLEQVTAIEPALSDPHSGRRCVMALTFADGTRLVYKPRDMGIEASYYRFLRWCNEQGANPPFKILGAIARPTYGWIEFVEYKPCLDQQEVQRYYQRAGMLLCIVYMLGGLEYSYENIIVCGEHPVLIDASGLLHHYPCPDHQDDVFLKQCSDWEQQAFTVLHTGLLASWQMNMGRQELRLGRDISGLAMNGSEISVQQEQFQLRPQRLSQALKYGMLRTHERLNMPLYAGNFPSPPEYRDAICAGFAHLYQLLLSHRDALLAADGELQVFRQQTVRVPYRGSQAYQTSLSKLLQPEFLRDGVTYSMELERLFHTFVPVKYKFWREANSARWRQVWQAEQQSLLRGDIPFFTAHANSAMLLVDRPLEFCLHEPSFDLLLQRVKQLGDSEMHKQIGLIQGALRRSITPVRLNALQSGATYHTTDERELPPSDMLLAQSLAIADTIARQAIPVGKKAVTWVQPQLFLHSSRQQLQPVRYRFFNDAAGVALFLAAIARVSVETQYGVLARAAVEPLCQVLQDNGEALCREMGIGGAVGLGGVVYALTRVSVLLNDAVYLDAAREAACLISPEHIANDEALDVIAGSAGAILGLLTLYEASHDQKVLELAIACGQHLLQARTMSKAGCLAWPTLGRMHTTGFSHGTAGIVYALLRLYAATADAKLLEAAQEGLIYENCAFVSKAGNWAEVLNIEEPAYMATWCHGAPGIGLARIGGLPVLDTAQMRQDIEIALQTTQKMGVLGLDPLCCGNSGRAEILLTASQKLARPELAGIARRSMWSILTRAERKGTFLLNSALPNWVPNIGLFQGTSGIGYTLLRMIYPDLLPSVLLWE